MKSISAAGAKNGFGQLIDIARQEPVTIEKHGRAVVVVISIEEYARLTDIQPHPRQPIEEQQGDKSGQA